MTIKQPLKILPQEFQAYWQASVTEAASNPKGAFRLVNIRKTDPHSFEELRIIVLVLDENGFPLPGVKIAFSYSTANQYLIDQAFTWLPPSPHRADIVPTQGGGQIEHIQGSVVQSGQPGGVTVYVVEPEYSSDIISGAGALADHTGLHLTFQLQRVGVRSIFDEIKEIKARLDAVEGNAA